MDKKFLILTMFQMKYLTCVALMNLIGPRFEKFHILFPTLCRAFFFSNLERITCNDLIRSGQGHVVINILSDLNGFWSYENREMIFAEANEEDV